MSELDMLVPHLLPSGRRSGAERVAPNPTRNDTRLGSFKINMNTDPKRAGTFEFGANKMSGVSEMIADLEFFLNSPRTPHGG